MSEFISDVRERLRRFAADRDWDQFHSPKNLAIALSVEAAELLEHFQWISEQQSAALPARTLSSVGEELADILIYLIRLADKLDVDLVQATHAKIELNEKKYPADVYRGTARKYSDI